MVAGEEYKLVAVEDQTVVEGEEQTVAKDEEQIVEEMPVYSKEMQELCRWME